jgi:DNA polymerase III delta prime subunit
VLNDNKCYFKSLLPLALDGTLVGKTKAAQALAKIAITTNPENAFPGQRVCYEFMFSNNILFVLFFIRCLKSFDQFLNFLKSRIQH